MTQPPGRSRRRRLVCLRSGLRPSLRHTKRIGPQPSHEHWYRDRGGVTFQAEYQNEPVRPTLTVAGLDREQLAKRSIPLRRGIMPNSHTTLTAAIDIQERLLFWSVASWGGGYSGHLLACGTHPEQPGENFTASSAKRTLSDLHPGGFEATLQAGLTTLVDMLLGREWPREDGTIARIEQLVIDAKWG